LFEEVLRAGQPWNRFGPNEESVHMVYNYTKVERAIEILQKRELSWWGDSFVARLLLSYPSLAAGGDDDMASLPDLAGDLCLRFRCVPKLSFLPEWVVEPIVNFDLQILSTGPLVGTYHSPPEQQQGWHASTPVTNNAERRRHVREKHQLLNVSAYFTASGSR
jgi:hypothetical protein